MQINYHLHIKVYFIWRNLELRYRLVCCGVEKVSFERLRPELINIYHDNTGILYIVYKDKLMFQLHFCLSHCMLTICFLWAANCYSLPNLHLYRSFDMVRRLGKFRYIHLSENKIQFSLTAVCTKKHKARPHMLSCIDTQSEEWYLWIQYFC